MNPHEMRRRGVRCLARVSLMVKLFPELMRRRILVLVTLSSGHSQLSYRVVGGSHLIQYPASGYSSDCHLGLAYERNLPLPQTASDQGWTEGFAWLFNL